MELATMREALIRRLRTVSALDDEDAHRLRELPATVKSLRAGELVLREGERPKQSCFVIEGFCARSKNTFDGKRQILSIHIPGDMPDLQTVHLPQMDHDLFTLTDADLGCVSHADLQELYRRHPSLQTIFWREALIEASIFREWILNVGQRPAPSRLAHIFVELRERLKIIGRADDNEFEMPVTQEQIGEALGISWVHTNRVLSMLRREGIVQFHRGRVTVLDRKRLEELAQFDGRYLHRAPLE